MRTQRGRIVIVLTNHADLGDTGKKTGYHLESSPFPTWSSSGRARRS